MEDKGEDMTPNKLAKKSGITNTELISLLKERFPNYSKIANSMANNPEKYGLRLTAEAEKLIKGEKKAPISKPKNPSITISSDLKSKIKSSAEANGVSVEEYLRGLINDR